MADEPAVNGSSEQGGDDVDIDISSNDSTPTKHVPFHPLFRVQVPDAIKDGEALQFTIRVYKWDADTEISSIIRQFEDFEWLHHGLITQNTIDGVIVPPLPPRPEVDAKAAESKSKKQLGSDTRLIKPDDFSRDCRHVEKYLRLMLGHEVFGQDKSLEKFLCEKEAPIRTKVNRGILSKMSSAVELARKGQHRDIDEYFSKKREWAVDYSKAIKEMSGNFNKMVYTQMRLSTCYGHVSTALNCTGAQRDDVSVKINKYLSKLSEATEDYKHGLEVLSNNDEKTLGFQLELYSRYIESVREMMFRRTCSLISYEDANRALDKAKAQKKAAAEETKLAAQKTYEDCSETARREMKTFLQQRMLAVQDGMVTFAESQIKTARDTYTLLAKTMTALKQMDV